MTTRNTTEPRRFNPFTGRDETLREMIAAGRVERAREVARFFGAPDRVASRVANAVSAGTTKAPSAVRAKLWSA